MPARYPRIVSLQPYRGSVRLTLDPFTVAWEDLRRRQLAARRGLGFLGASVFAAWLLCGAGAPLLTFSTLALLVYIVWLGSGRGAWDFRCPACDVFAWRHARMLEKECAHCGIRVGTPKELRVLEPERALSDLPPGMRVTIRRVEGLHVLSQDEGKKRLRTMVAGMAVLFLAVAVGGAIAVKNSLDATARLEQEIRQLKADKEKIGEEHRNPRSDLPADLEAQIAAMKDRQNALMQQQSNPGATHPVRVAPFKQGGGGGTRPPCNCTPGDPLCSCL
jgi:hypothetical protein